MVLDSGH